jgi:hypothetical protein
MGGMGNQMFQYAIGRQLALKHNTELKLDLSFLLDRTPIPNFVFRDYDLSIFNINADIASNEDIKKIIGSNKYTQRLTRTFNKVLPIKNRNYFVEPHFHYTHDVLMLSKDVYTEGYWQSYKYFQDIEEAIRKEFTFKKDILPSSLNLVNKIKLCNSICLNVRRADFVENSYHGTTNISYYDEALSILEKSLGRDLEIFIFSDDIQWCKENLKFDYPITIVNYEHKGEKFGNYLQLMTSCKHFIIPNSSFAWWAAYLSNYKEKIIVAPKKWFNDEKNNTSDLMPQDWIRI